MPRDAAAGINQHSTDEGVYLFCLARPQIPPTLEVGGLDDRYCKALLSGPWPPYNFVNEK